MGAGTIQWIIAMIGTAECEPPGSPVCRSWGGGELYRLSTSLVGRDLNHAIQLMSKHPGVKVGPFEIRPAEDLTALVRDSEERRRSTVRRLRRAQGAA